MFAFHAHSKIWSFRIQTTQLHEKKSFAQTFHYLAPTLKFSSFTFIILCKFSTLAIISCTVHALETVLAAVRCIYMPHFLWYYVFKKYWFARKRIIFKFFSQSLNFYLKHDILFHIQTLVKLLLTKILFLRHYFANSWVRYDAKKQLVFSRVYWVE